MAEQQYDLLFSGQVLEGFFVDFVKADIQNLFKANQAYVDQLFSGQEQRIKSAVDKATAIKFQQAFKKAGAKLVVKAHDPSKQATQASSKTRPSADTVRKSTPNTSTAAFEITTEAVAGENASDLIEHHQPDILPPTAAPSWDISAPGIDLVEPAPASEVNIDTSDLSVANVGESLISAPMFEEPAPVISTDGLSLAEPGGTIETIDDQKPPVQVDISHLSVE
jgi:hypothetical protein